MTCSKFQLAAHLKESGFAVLLVPDTLAGGFHLTLASFHAQADIWIIKGPPETYTGFTCNPHRRRFEHSLGDGRRHDLGALQHCADNALLNIEHAAKSWLQAIAESYGLSASTFETLLDVAKEEAPASRLEAMQYTVPRSAAECHVSCREHIDRGLLTLVYSDCGQGLQVQDKHGSWIDVHAPKGSLVVLAGYTLERATCGLIKASRHRVVMSGHDGAFRRNVLAYKLRAPDSAVLDLYSQLQATAECFGAPPLNTLYKNSIGVKELMHFFNAMHASINGVAHMPSASSPKMSTGTGAPVTPMAPTTPTRFDVVGELPRSAGRSRPGLRNFCKHGQREALRRTSCKRSRALSQETSGRKKGRADEPSEANSTIAGSATALEFCCKRSRAPAVAATRPLKGLEVQATSSTSENACAPCHAVDESSAVETHANTQEQMLLHQDTAQVSDPKTSQHQEEINVQLSSPALFKDIVTVQVDTPFAVKLNIKASQSVLVQDLQNALKEQFVNLGHDEWTDGKLLCDGEVLRWDRTVRSYAAEAQEFDEPFGPIEWVLSQYGD